MRAVQRARQRGSLRVRRGRNPPSWAVEGATALSGSLQLQREKARPLTWMVMTIWLSKMNLKQSMALPLPSSSEYVLAVQFWCIWRVGNSQKTQLMTVSWLITQNSCVRVVKVRKVDDRFTVLCTSTTSILPVKSRQKRRQSLLLSCCTLLRRAGARTGRLETTACLLRNQRRVVGEGGAGKKEYSVILQKQSTSASARQQVVLAKGLQQVRAQMQPQVVGCVTSCPISLILSRKQVLYFCFRQQSSSSYRLSGPSSLQRSKLEEGAEEEAPREQAQPLRMYPIEHCLQRLLDICEVHPGMGERQKPKVRVCPEGQAVQSPLSWVADWHNECVGVAARRRASSRMEIWMFMRIYNRLPVQEHFQILSIHHITPALRTPSRKSLQNTLPY